ncbi:MAG TPA: hypothetical protein VFT42_03845 [Solirubrobacteraceae bacterium]|nr:hypothetical protein [Solirubrobacteraceae bacterium]
MKWRIRAERVGLVAGMALSAMSMWTAAPLLGLWVGSRVAAAQGQTTMLAVLVVAVTIFVCGYALARALAGLGARWEDMTGAPRNVRTHLPWLRSMRGERPHDAPGAEAHLTPLEVVLVVVVVLCYVAFEIWFFFFSTSPIDQRSGR